MEVGSTLTELNEQLDQAACIYENSAQKNVRQMLVMMRPVSDQDAVLRDTAVRIVERLQFQRVTEEEQA